MSGGVPIILGIGVVFAQVSELPGWISNLGFGGILIWIVFTRLDKLDHTIKGLSMALWMDLASRPHADEFIRDEAKKMLARMDTDRK